MDDIIHNLNKKEVYLALTDPETLGTVLHAIILKTYGEEVNEIDPVELFLRLEEDFGAQPCIEAENRIQAILLATTTDSFYQVPDAFTSICDTLVNGDPGMEQLEPLTLAEVIWGVYEVELNHPGAEMSKQVHALVQEVTNEEAEEAGDYAYIFQFLQEQRDKLKHQLEKVGFKDIHLPPVTPPEPPQ